jgi:O-antigen/teichoic acid export membrane protein
MGGSSLKEKTAKGLFWGGMSNGIQQLLGLVFGIFLARLLSPSDYGLVGMLAIFSALADAIPESGLGMALINKKEIRREDCNAVFWVNMALAAFCYLLMFFMAPLIARFFHTPELVLLARCSFLVFLISSAAIVPAALLQKELRIKERAISNIVSMTMSGLVGIWLAYRGFGYWTLVIQSFVYSTLMTVLYWYFSEWRPSFKVNLQPVKEMYGFAVRILVTNVVDIVNTNFFSVVLGRLYTKNEVGYYNQANKWSLMGSSLIRGMVNSVAQPVLVEVSDSNERQHRVFRRIVRFTAFVSFPAMLGLAFIAPELITITITEKWLPSAEMLQILCLGSAFIPLSHVFSSLVISKGRSSAYMWCKVSLCILLFISMLLVYPYGIRWMIITYSIINMFWVGVWFLLVRKDIQYSFMQLAGDLIPFLGITVAIIAGVFFLTRGIENMYWSMCAKIFLVAGTYILTMWISGSVTFRDCVQFVLNRFRKNR